MSDSSKIIFVTGASGYLASHVVYQLAEQGHRVRASVRKNKMLPVRDLYLKSHPNVEIVQIDDLAQGDLGDVFKGVDVVIHTASPLPGRGSAEVILKGAIEGSLNVLQQAEKAGVRKFVVTSSTLAVTGDPSIKDGAYRAEHWSPWTKEDAERMPYVVSKKFAELAVWDWAEAHPHVDVTVINPPFLYGPLAPIHLPVAPGDYISLSTALMVYNLISPDGTYPPEPAYTDVRDTAAAHVRAALSALPKETSTDIKSPRKRVVFASPHGVVFKDVLDMIRNARPELAGRIISKGSVPEFEIDRYHVDFGRIEEIVGLKKEDFHTLEETLLDTIDDMLALEKEWVAQGYVLPPNVPPMML
ncbi:NAD(P)-binding protein [Agrocybe pediades]|nr:NAD(P)-binding protein [Agrocybe pediades]